MELPFTCKARTLSWTLKRGSVHYLSTLTVTHTCYTFPMCLPFVSEPLSAHWSWDLITQHHYGSPLCHINSPSLGAPLHCGNCPHCLPPPPHTLCLFIPAVRWQPNRFSMIHVCPQYKVSRFWSEISHNKVFLMLSDVSFCMFFGIHFGSWFVNQKCFAFLICLPLSYVHFWSNRHCDLITYHSIPFGTFWNVSSTVHHWYPTASWESATHHHALCASGSAS